MLISNIVDKSLYGLTTAIKYELLLYNHDQVEILSQTRSFSPK